MQVWDAVKMISKLFGPKSKQKQLYKNMVINIQKEKLCADETFWRSCDRSDKLLGKQKTSRLHLSEHHTYE